MQHPASALPEYQIDWIGGSRGDLRPELQSTSATTYPLSNSQVFDQLSSDVLQISMFEILPPLPSEKSRANEFRSGGAYV